MTTHEVLVKARNIQERRGFNWSNPHVDQERSCCPAACIAAATDSPDHCEINNMGAAAALMLAREFRAEHRTFSFESNAGYKLSAASFSAVGWSLKDVLAKYDAAIAKTAPEPQDLELDVEEVLVA
jgi:hypothetical protein